MSVIGAIGSFATGTYTRTRTATGTTVNGLYTAGSTSTATIVAVVQPLAGADLQVLPEGRHAEHSRVVFSESDLRVSPVPDQITIDGEAYEVFRSQPWVAFGQSFYRAVVSRLVVP